MKEQLLALYCTWKVKAISYLFLQNTLLQRNLLINILSELIYSLNFIFLNFALSSLSGSKKKKTHIFASSPEIANVRGGKCLSTQSWKQCSLQCYRKPSQFTCVDKLRFQQIRSCFLKWKTCISKLTTCVLLNFWLLTTWFWK